MRGGLSREPVPDGSASSDADGVGGWLVSLILAIGAPRRAARLIVLGLVACCCVVFLAKPNAHPGSFSSLQQGDILVVQFHSSGCFHGATHELTFQRGAELTVSVVQIPSGTVRSPRIAEQTNRVALGTLRLSQSDVAGLDRLMDYYHSKRSGDCTTIDDITFTQQRGDEIVASEQIVDAPCHPDEMESILRFPDLIARVSSRP